MANYGAARMVTITDLEKRESVEIVSTPGDYLRTKRWMGEQLKGVDDEARGMYGDFAWAWFAAAHAGMSDELGMKGQPTVEKIDKAMDRLAVGISMLEDGFAPLRQSSQEK